MSRTLAIGIPSYQRRDQLAVLLDSVAISYNDVVAQIGDGRVEVIVVLDGSTDGSHELVEASAATFPIPLRSVWQENGGLASARNLIVDSTESELVWFVDDDMTVTPAALIHHWARERSEASVLMGPCVVADGSEDLDEMRSFYALRHERLGGSGFVSSAGDASFANTSAPRSLLVAEPFDQRYRGYGMEDYDLGARLLDRGVCIAFDPAAAITHHPVSARGGRRVKLREEGANRIRFIDRHPTHRDAVFDPRPARFERLARTAARAGLATALWRAGALLERASQLAPLARHQRRLQYWADTCAVHCGVADQVAARDEIITVVMPAHDAANTIADALKSLRAQTSTSWEAVVVDDGSTDDTSKIIADLASRDSRIRLVRQGNEGAAAARNAGWRVATSPWLLFLDADDRIDDTYIQQMQSALRTDSSAGGVRCEWAYETDDGRIEKVVDRQLHDGVDLFTASAESSPFAIHSCVIRADLVEAVGGFDHNLRIFEDWDLWQRIGRIGAPILTVRETLAFYRLRANSAMRINNLSAIFDALTVYRRTHSEDSRVPNAALEYRHGAAIDESRDIVAEWVAWTVGVGIPNGGGHIERLPSRTPPSQATLGPEVVAGTLYGAVPFGSCSLHTDWPQLWLAHADSIRAALETYETWSGHRDIAQYSMRHLERLIAMNGVDAHPLLVGSTLGVQVDLNRRLNDLQVPEGVDRIIVTVTASPDVLIGVAEVPALGRVLQAADMRSAIDRQLSPTLARRRLERPATAIGCVRSSVDRRRLGMLVRLTLDMPLGDRRAVRDVVRRFTRAAFRPPPNLEPSPSDLGTLPTDEANGQGDGSSAADTFERAFSNEDPWNYTTTYEQTKYEQTLSLLDGIRPAKALELACAEGHFTAQIAPRVEYLTATDISPTAVARAAERCAELDNVEFGVLDLSDHVLPSGQDLIICSEVLYYLDDEADLASFSDRIADALAPGGHFLTAHAKITEDEPGVTGFTFARYGVKRIDEILSESKRLALEREIETPLYRIGLYRRAEPGDRTSSFTEQRKHGELDLQLHRRVAWGGVAMTRSKAMSTEVTARLPVLMYHRVAGSGVADLDRYRIDPEQFEAQLDHLRRHGYYGITAERWTFAMRQHRALPGRAVMLTFDDGYRDFLEEAFPLLDAYGFPATVFVVPQLVGGFATWDARFGEPAPLLSWEEIKSMASRGMEFASHSDAHVALDLLGAQDAFTRERQARLDLRKHLGYATTVLAYPFGAHDTTVRETMRKAGYRVGFTCDPGLATVWDDPLRIPRIEVRGDDDLEAFAAKLPPPTRRNPLPSRIGDIKRLGRRTVNR